MTKENFFEACRLMAECGINYKENENVANYSSFKIGGTALLAVFPTSREELVNSLKILGDCQIKREVVGNASNLLFAFDRFCGAIVFTGKLSGFAFNGERAVADCGVSLTRLSSLAADRGLGTLEFAYGIPALVGGAIYMNAGAYGSSVSEVLFCSTAYDCEKDQVISLSLGEHCFDYRKSIYMSRPSLVCLGGEFLLRKGSSDEIKEKMSEHMSARREKQPLEFPSAGSYFKRPEGQFAGKLIEDCGLKGETVGGAQVSSKHAGFIINRGGATAHDVLMLEEKIKERVFDRFGVMLQREVRVIE